MTKEEALQMCLEYIETDAHERKYVRHAIKKALEQPERDYERGFIDGMSKQAQSSVDKAVNAMTQPRNFCPRCGKRTPDLTTIHTCTPPRGLEMT